MTAGRLVMTWPMCHMVIWTEVSDGEGKFGWRATLGNVRGTRDEVVGGMESELVPTEPSQTSPRHQKLNIKARKKDSNDAALSYINKELAKWSIGNV